VRAGAEQMPELPAVAAQVAAVVTEVPPVAARVDAVAPEVGRVPPHVVAVHRQVAVVPPHVAEVVAEVSHVAGPQVLADVAAVLAQLPGVTADVALVAVDRPLVPARVLAVVPQVRGVVMHVPPIPMDVGRAVLGARGGRPGDGDEAAQGEGQEDLSHDALLSRLHRSGERSDVCPRLRAARASAAACSWNPHGRTFMRLPARNLRSRPRVYQGSRPGRAARCRKGEPMEPLAKSLTVARWMAACTAGIVVGIGAALALGRPVEALVGMMLVTPILTMLVGASLGTSQWL
jgi:hypothetical protein